VKIRYYPGLSISRLIFFYIKNKGGDGEGMTHPVLEGAYALALGGCVGSFVTLASHRLPRGEDIVLKPSRCTSCDTALHAPDLVPVLSWCVRKGRCRHCGAKVSARYPLTEIATALLFLLVQQQFGLSWIALVMALLVTVLMILIVIDLEHQIIPDSLQIALLALAIAYHLLRHDGWLNPLCGAALGLGLGLALRYGYLYLRKLDALGMGDVKFLCVAGLWLGAGAFALMLFFAGVIGTLMGVGWKLAGRGPRFPFGPALAAALFTCVCWRDALSSFAWTRAFYLALGG
jgi:prepilin signal peptidase PulO-like enzyme (type II secretory pathway)